MNWTLALILTIAGVTTNHTVSEVAFNRTNLVTYVESGNTYLCTKASYEFSGPPWTVKLISPSCVPDKLFGSGFE